MRIRRTILLGFAFIATSAGAASWTDSARRLSGESDRVRSAAIRTLRATPKLEDRLREAFPTRDRFLAFDVAVALGLRSLVPDLIDFSRKDETGYSYHTLNALASGEEMRKVVGIYLSRIGETSLAPVAKMAILDSLARTSAEIPVRTLRRLIEDSYPEVRDSALGYLRSAIVRRKRVDLLSLAAVAVTDPADAIRLRALSILGEASPAVRRTLGAALAPALAACREDPLPEARAACLRLTSGDAR